MAKAKNKEKEKKTKSGKKGSSDGKSLFLPKFLSCCLLIAVFLILLGVTWIPVESVPPSLVEFHSVLLTARNTAIARSGLPISRYEDSVTVEPAGSPAVRIYFAPSPKISAALCEFIASARDSLDLCIYDLNLPDVTDALKSARNRGVRVRMITDDEKMSNASIRSLEQWKIPVKNDARAPIMHHKFAVADGMHVWTGSFNFTTTGALKNDNNAIVLDSPALAAVYTDKFNEYWRGKFGPAASARTANGKILFGRIPVEAAFSPADRIQNKILQELDYARKSVDIMAFSFTSDEIADRLKVLAKKGVAVRCLFDREQAASVYSRDETLKGYGARIRISSNGTGKMHHKVILIDGETVITGSYNYSRSADTQNDENILLIRDSAIAAAYQKEFLRCWRGTKGY